MSIDAVTSIVNASAGTSPWATTAANATGLYTTPATTMVSDGNNAMDKEAFLGLLVAALRYQDPTSPMSTSEMMQQTTQLASMEQLAEMTTISQENFALQMRIAAANLVGTQVTYLDAKGTTATGEVTAVSYAASVPTVVVNGIEIPLDHVAAVNAAAPADAVEDPDQTDEPTDPGEADPQDGDVTSVTTDPAGTPA